MILAVDSETNGIDFQHGAKPFFVTTCSEDREQLFWEWVVNPLTREPQIPEGDVDEICQLLASADLLVFQNPKFDFTAFRTIGVWDRLDVDETWLKVRDTLTAGHLLASNQPHDLTSMVMKYLRKDITPYEERLKKACNEARRMARSKFPKWAIAKEGRPDMPSAKSGSKKDKKGVESESPWKFDTWLPKALAQELKLPSDHLWWTVTQDYTNTDSATTLPLWLRMEKMLHSRGLWEVYLARLKALPIAYHMEERGVTLSSKRLEELQLDYSGQVVEAAEKCISIAADFGYNLELPKGASPNGNLRKFFFDVMKLQPIHSKKAKTSAPTLDKGAMNHYLATLPAESKELEFVTALVGKRSRDTALAYMEGYRRFWSPYLTEKKKLDLCFSPVTVPSYPLPRQLLFRDFDDWRVLHPSLNTTGTDTLRWSSASPNEQNISKKENFNLRYCFGPAPGREWWSLDFQNLELRIPTYKAGEQDLIEVFEHPNDAPYYGSYHLVVCDLIYPELFKKHGKAFKTVFESTYYQWVKNGNFAIIYGAQEETADTTYHVKGAYKRLRHRFPKIAALSDQMLAKAEKNGLVETIPDRTVSSRGYPLLCTRSEWGKILPTVPLNYFVQGSAMWLTQQAMVKCEAKLRMWREDGFDAYIVLQVHDELVFDFPRGKEVKSNIARIRVLQRCMQSCGDDIGVPTPVSVEYHPVSWDKGVAV